MSVDRLLLIFIIAEKILICTRQGHKSDLDIPLTEQIMVMIAKYELIRA